MKSIIRKLGVASVAVCGVTSALAQNVGSGLPPLSYDQMQQLRASPRAWHRFLEDHRASNASGVVEAISSTPDGWKVMSHWLPGGALPSNPLLLTDGTVLMHASCKTNWYKLTPDINGNYVRGTWSTVASMPSGYAPRFFASAVLPDGRVIVEGGEYNGAGCTSVWTNQGAIYDPVQDTWTSVSPPNGWNNIGDASSVLLPDTTYLLSNALSRDLAEFDESNLTWNEVGGDKFDVNDEENWTLLPSGDVLTVDAFVKEAGCKPQSEIFSDFADSWFDGGTTVVQLSDCASKTKTYEGPTQILRPNGTVVAFGATTSKPTQNYAAHTAIYDPTAFAWSQGPDVPGIGGTNYTMVDAPAAILSNGNALVAASPGEWRNASTYPTPTHFFSFDGTTFTRIADIADSARLASYQINLLVLPTGEILCVETDRPRIQILPTQGSPLAAWAPVVTTISSTTLKAGVAYMINGTQLSGVTQGAGMGDDEQAHTNFPLVRVVNSTTKHVFYARTTFTSASVEPNNPSTATFVLPTSVETGASKLFVVANGIPSKSISVTITPPRSP